MDLVCIWAAGSDMELRRAGWTLLEKGLAHNVDLLDRSRLYLKGHKRKTGASGRSIMIVADRPRLSEVMKALRAAYLGDDLRAYATPVLEALH